MARNESESLLFEISSFIRRVVGIHKSVNCTYSRETSHHITSVERTIKQAVCSYTACTADLPLVLHKRRGGARNLYGVVWLAVESNPITEESGRFTSQTSPKRNPCNFSLNERMNDLCNIYASSA